MRFLHLFAILLLFSSTNAYALETFAFRGVSFTIPEGWTIANDAETGENFFYRALEKGWDDAEAITVSCVTLEDEVMDLDNWLAEIRQEMESVKMMSFTFDGYSDGQYGQYTAKKMTTTLSIFDLTKNRYTAYALQNDTIACVISEQAESKHFDKMQADFQVMRTSFKLSTTQ